MGLSSSMWTSVSGLLAHGDKMNVVGNNIANVSTIGFKSQRMDFNDYLYINGGSTSGPTQIGAGVSNYAVIGDFSQGSLESTNSVTDLAIDGNGFFKVRQPNSEQTYYTRAGDFYFNADRQLQNPEGYRLQGWKIDNSTRLTFKSDSVNLGENVKNESAFQGTGTPVDIVLDSWYLEPQRTSSINFTMGLTSDGNSDRSTSTNSPMTALFDQWDATKNPPMADSSYATSSSIKVYDEGGNPHTMTVYYDQVATKATDSDGNVLYEVAGLPAGYTMYEYVVTVPPEEDMRSYGGTGFDQETNEFTGTPPTSFYNDPIAGTNKMAGMMMTGHLIFDAAGNLVNQTAYSYGATADPGILNQCSQDPAKLGSWQATKFSSNGLPVFCANFTGQPLANSVNEVISPTQSQAQDYLIELDLGLRTRGDWNFAGSLEDLAGEIVLPSENSSTPIPLATKVDYPTVTFQPATEGKPAVPPADPDDPNDNGTPAVQGSAAKWVNTAVNPPVEVNYSKSPSIFLSITQEGSKEPTRIELQQDKKSHTGVATTFVAKDAAGNYAEVPAGTEDATECYVGIDGKPIFDKKGEPIKFQPTTDTLVIERSLKVVPENVLAGDYTKVDNGIEVDVDVQTSVYAKDSNGARREVLVDDDGVILGYKDGQKPEYSGERLYFDKAVSTRKIDYNTQFSTYDDPIRAENATKAGSSSFITQDAGQNGYASGVLSGTNITADGVVYGYYDNGETVPLYQIALYDFHNLQGLRREGGNLLAQTKESGEARQGVAGEAGFGQVKAYNIEGSNVDLSREFVNMITTQRGFQANSKGITTIDTMLETVIGMKR